MKVAAIGLGCAGNMTLADTESRTGSKGFGR
jgi:hypothetical protein